MTIKSTRSIGNAAEALAVQFLLAKGYTVVDQNYRFDRAEIDIIAFDGNIVVFVEVKMRSTTQFGYPEEFVDDKKIEHIYKAAEAWLQERGFQDRFARFDVISIVQSDNKQPKIKHLIDAFR